MRGLPWFVAAILVAVAWPAGFGSEKQPASRSVRDGVYTEAQAARGKAVYLEQCVECHKQDLRGDGQMTPSLVGIGFTFR
ncbi:MAG: c-type cytochrome, partial [Pseudomonadales bacterium]|nr:c-type cytochrome [Pseudomonadales bacterium]